MAAVTPRHSANFAVAFSRNAGPVLLPCSLPAALWRIRQVVISNCLTLTAPCLTLTAPWQMLQPGNSPGLHQSMQQQSGGPSSPPPLADAPHTAAATLPRVRSWGSTLPSTLSALSSQLKSVSTGASPPFPGALWAPAGASRHSSHACRRCSLHSSGSSVDALQRPAAHSRGNGVSSGGSDAKFYERQRNQRPQGGSLVSPVWGARQPGELRVESVRPWPLPPPPLPYRVQTSYHAFRAAGSGTCFKW